MTKKIAILGSGSWASALAKIIHENVDTLYWYVREAEIIESLQLHSRNSLYVSDISYNIDRLYVSDNINEIVDLADIIIFCVPSKFIISLCGSITSDLSHKELVTAIKGMEPVEITLISEYLKKRFGVNDSQTAVISGPCHAEEVALEHLSYLTIGSQNQDLATEVSGFLSTYYIRTCTSHDVAGIEYASVLKNIMALATGIAIGLGYGDNFISVLISNAIQEMQRFINTANPLARDINDSVYLGDLLVTAYSQFSRNRTFGTMIGRGYSVQSAELQMNMIAEGYYGAHCITQINQKLNVDMPITLSVYNILYNKISPSMEFKILAKNLR
ncbi:MAG: NAD(P)H-dependent glycerol-3-phosphate dehydrogenase [Bacteroidales bacterium]|jgi:glycerol-3-phosphate dehydrogenase (NAD(P)+)|nr:NAD(P)H-dependent glycerol-3-phosphate dehydrogenase [Bacteroidales bacterium]